MRKTVANYPELVAQWHPTKNGELKPGECSHGSGRKVWWKCPVADDHEWEAMVYSRRKGNGCPHCAGKITVLSNCLATTHPGICNTSWHSKNKLSPYEITAGSGKKVWWKCSVADDHEWMASPNNRVKQNQGCPYCRGLKVTLSNCLMTTHPDLCLEWHPKNKLTPYEVTFGSHKKVWWKCSVADDHEWEAIVLSRTYNRGCPCCVGHKVVLSNCLMTTHPDLCLEWHPKNKLTPYNITAGCNVKVWWKCSVADDHEWEATPNNRIGNKTGCPFCNESKGERKISDVLDSLHIVYTREHNFDTCRNKYPLFFDFFVDNKYIIEYQGEQHYKIVKFSNRMSEEQMLKNLKQAQLHDHIKRQWCRTNNIPLLEIPYWNYDKIPELVERFLMGVA